MANDAHARASSNTKDRAMFFLVVLNSKLEHVLEREILMHTHKEKIKSLSRLENEGIISTIWGHHHGLLNSENVMASGVSGRYSKGVFTSVVSKWSLRKTALGVASRAVRQSWPETSSAARS